MKKLLTPFLLLLSICAFAQNETEFVFSKLTLEEARKKAEEEHKNIFVLVTADWVALGKTFKKEVLGDPEIKKALNEWYVSIELDPDSSADFIRQWGVGSMPTSIFFDHKLNQLGRLVGAVEKARFYAGVNYVKPKE